MTSKKKDICGLWKSNPTQRKEGENDSSRSSLRSCGEKDSDAGDFSMKSYGGFLGGIYFAG